MAIDRKSFLAALAALPFAPAALRGYAVGEEVERDERAVERVEPKPVKPRRSARSRDEWIQVNRIQVDFDGVVRYDGGVIEFGAVEVSSQAVTELLALLDGREVVTFAMWKRTGGKAFDITGPVACIVTGVEFSDYSAARDTMSCRVTLSVIRRERLAVHREGDIWPSD